MKIRDLLIIYAALMSSAPIYADDSIVVYSGRSDKFVKPVVAEFSKQSGINVILHSGKATALLNKLKTEGARTEADLFLSNDAGSLQKGSEFGLFSKLPHSVTQAIPKNYRAEDSTWIGLSARARVLVVNTQAKLALQPKSVFDLANPAFKGRLGITNSTNGSYIAGVTVYMQAAGEEKTRNWLSGMKTNVGGEVFNKHSKIVKAVASGKKDVGLVNHYYIYRHLDKHPDAPIKIVLPDQEKGGMGVAWNVAGIALSKHTKKVDAALKFIQFLVSESGQKMFAEVNREYPTRSGVAASKPVPAAGSYTIADVAMSELGKQRDKTLDLIESVGMP